MSVWTPDNGDGTFKNPLMWGDWPDPDIIRVGDDFYFISTSMHYVPGCPIATSKDLVNWRMAGYAVPRYDEDSAWNFDGGAMYLNGSWAATIRHHNGLFYVGFSTPPHHAGVTGDRGTGRGRFSMCVAKDVKGPWKRVIFPENLYDPGLLFDDDGKVYVAHGQNTLYVTELAADALSVKGPAKQVFTGLHSEGCHFYKIGGRYYITGPTGGTTGRQICLRSDSPYGPYEVKEICNDASSYPPNGLHQGGMVQLKNGDWWFVIMQDRDGIGRVPHLVPVKWVDGWPMLGERGEGKGVIVATKPAAGDRVPVEVPATSDDFAARELGLQWQWNHNPDDAAWSLAERPGYLRLKAGKSASLWLARNTLTQRTQGPACDGIAVLNLEGLRDGSVAGLGIFESPYAYLAIKRDNGVNRIVMAQGTKGSDAQLEKEIAVVPSFTGKTVWLKASVTHADGGRATFSWSADGTHYTPLGGTLRMGLGLYWTANRFALFHFATRPEAVGAAADFDTFVFRGDNPRVPPLPVRTGR